MSDQDKITLGKLEMAGMPSRSERCDAAANRKLILETAEKLFAEHGVDNVNMAQIAQAAQVGKGTIYRRFANKAELCLALLDTQMTDFQNVMLDRMRHMTVGKVTPLGQLDQFLDALVYFIEDHAPLLCEVQREGLLGSSQDVQLPHFWLHMTAKGLLRQAVEAGEISPRLDVEYVADALLMSLRANVFWFQRQVRGYSLERISAGLRTMVTGLRFIELG
jgi:AcrR family transcriptional regulator